jgi:hypothetical protein
LDAAKQNDIKNKAAVLYNRLRTPRGSVTNVGGTHSFRPRVNESDIYAMAAAKAEADANAAAVVRTMEDAIAYVLMEQQEPPIVVELDIVQLVAPTPDPESLRRINHAMRAALGNQYHGPAIKY